MSMTMSEQPSRFDRVLAATPLLGPLSRAIAKDVNLIFYILVILLTALVIAIKTFGIVALVVTYLALIPFIFAFFIIITLP